MVGCYLLVLTSRNKEMDLHNSGDILFCCCEWCFEREALVEGQGLRKRILPTASWVHPLLPNIKSPDAPNIQYAQYDKLYYSGKYLMLMVVGGCHISRERGLICMYRIESLYSELHGCVRFRAWNPKPCSLQSLTQTAQSRILNPKLQSPQKS